MNPYLDSTCSSPLTRFRAAGELCLVPSLRHPQRLLTPSFQAAERSSVPASRLAWLFPLPTSLSATPETRFNTQ